MVQANKYCLDRRISRSALAANRSFGKENLNESCPRDRVNGRIASLNPETRNLVCHLTLRRRDDLGHLKSTVHLFQQLDLVRRCVAENQFVEAIHPLRLEIWFGDAAPP